MSTEGLGTSLHNFRQVRMQPVDRSSERRHGEALRKITQDIIELYRGCSNDFGYSMSLAPRRVLTKLTQGCFNGGYDNAEHDYICRVGDKIVDPDGRSYELLERLGHGTFGQVLRCNASEVIGETGSREVALKVCKNKPTYFHQALVEVWILQMLNKMFDEKAEPRIVRMLDFFVYREHLCIVFELLGVNLFEVLKQNSFRGVRLHLIRTLTEQLLKAMRCLREAHIIHCDLKPENVLLSSKTSLTIKLIDFGSACFEHQTVYPYIQSRFYRSPEVLLGLPYTTAIDMWSLGCICAELHLGLPIFPGQSEYDQVSRIIEVLGMPPQQMLDCGRLSRRYFRRVEEVVADAGDARCFAGTGGGDCDAYVAADLGDEGLADADPGGAAAAGGAGDGGAFAQAPGPHEVDAGDAAAAEALGIPPGAPCKGSLRRSESLLARVKRQFGLPADHQAAAAALAQAQVEGFGDEAAVAMSAVGAVLGRGNAAGSGGASDCAAEGAGSAASQHDTTASGTASCASLAVRRWDQAPSSEEPAREGSSDGLGPPLLGGDERPAQAEPPSAQRRQRGRRLRRFWRLKSLEEFERDEHKKEPPSKKYFEFKSLEEMLSANKQPKATPQTPQDAIRRQRFLDFLQGVLQVNPDVRWTPMQASQHPFITNAPYSPDWVPEPDPNPVPSFIEAVAPGIIAENLSGGGVVGEAVPRLPAEAHRAQAPGGLTLGGSSASTSSGMLRPPEAPAAPRAAGDASSAAAASAGASATAGRGLAAAVGSIAAAPDAAGAAAVRGVWWGGIPLPGEIASESYRPPIDKMSEEKLSNAHRMQMRGRSEMQGQFGGSHGAGSGSGAWSVSTGASLGSSASSTGSTPIGSRGRRGSRCDAPHPPRPRSCGQHRAFLESQSARCTGFRSGSSSGWGGPRRSGSTATTGSSPNGPLRAGGSGGSAASTSSHAAASGSGATRSGSAPPSRRGGGGGLVVRRGEGSRDGSRPSSPWHLSSPMSELSTASDRMNSSHPSGSDSCGENPLPLEGARCTFDGWEEDPSQSDGVCHGGPRSALSDSDSTTPRSHDAVLPDAERGKDIQVPRWENIRQLSRIQLSRGRLHRGGDDSTQNPGGIGGTFREKVGMNEGGPVTPFVPGGRRDPAGSMPQREAPEGEASSAPLLEAAGRSASGSGGPSGARLRPAPPPRA